jgi:hypothetical protein
MKTKQQVMDKIREAIRHICNRGHYENLAVMDTLTIVEECLPDVCRAVREKEWPKYVKVGDSAGIITDLRRLDGPKKLVVYFRDDGTEFEGDYLPSFYENKESFPLVPTAEAENIIARAKLTA